MYQDDWNGMELEKGKRWRKESNQSIRKVGLLTKNLPFEFATLRYRLTLWRCKRVMESGKWEIVGIPIVLAVLLVSFVQNTPEGQRWFDYWKSRWKATQFVHALQQDPPLGMNLSSLPQLRPINGISLPDMRKPLLIVVLQECEGCSVSLARVWAELMSATTWRKICGIMLVIQEEETKVKTVAVKSGWKIPVIADEEGRVAKALNAFFTPRAYGFEGGKLVWVQKEPHMSALEVLSSFLKVFMEKQKVESLLNAYSHELRERTWGKSAAAMVWGVRRRE